MKTFTETNLTAFEFWSGAKDNAAKLTSEQLDEVDAILSDAYPEGMDETSLNDLFWFDFETVLGWLGLEECDRWGELFEPGDVCECGDDE